MHKIRRALRLGMLTALGATMVVPAAQAAPVNVPAGIGVPPGYALPAETYGVGVDLGKVVPLSDGTKLAATVRYPTDPVSGDRAVGPFPVVVNFTTYVGLSGVATAAITGALKDALAQLQITPADPVLDLYRTLSQGTSAQDTLVRRGYIEVITDVRGTGSSTGQWDPTSPQDGRDGNELVDWAARLPNSSGKVGMFGYSFPGLSGMLTAGHTEAGTPLSAMVMFAVPNDTYSEVVGQGGMLNPILVTGLLPAVQALSLAGPLLNLPLTPAVAIEAFIDHLRGAFASPDSPLPKLLDGLNNGSFGHDDEWWTARSFRPLLPHLVGNNIPTYFVDGIWDIYQDGAFQNYAQLQNLAAGRPQFAPMAPGQRTDPRFQLLQGPWYHATLGAGPDARIDTDAVTVSWFDHWLKGIDNGVDRARNPLHVIDQTGAGANTPTFPFADATVRTYRLGTGRLGSDAFGSPDRLSYSPLENPCNRDNFEQTTGGFLQLALNLIDQRDPCATQQLGPETGLTYTGDPVEEPTMVAGPAGLTVYIRSTADDAALQAHLEDLAPDGTAVEITGGTQLATLRTLDEDRTWRTDDGSIYSPQHKLSSADVIALQPGQVVALDIRLRPTYYRLESGHRLCIRITTGNFPAAVAPLPRVPGLLGSAVEILHDGDHPSSLNVPIAPAALMQP